MAAILCVAIIGSFFAKRYGDTFLIGLFVACVVTSIVTATKIISIVGTNIPAGTIVFATTFLLTDTISEFYGKKRAQTAVWCGFSAMLLYLVYATITIHWPGAVFWDKQESYNEILFQSTRIALGGVIAFLVSQHLDVHLYHLFKTWTNGKYLWLRNTLSTSISQAVDSVVFLSIAFAGIYPVWDLFVGLYLAKVAIAVLDTPFIYIARMVHNRTVADQVGAENLTK